MRYATVPQAQVMALLLLVAGRHPWAPAGIVPFSLLCRLCKAAVQDKDSQRIATWSVVVAEMTEGLALLHFRSEDPGEILQGRLWGPGSAQGPFKLIEEQAPSRV